jgi:hypothetical protein
MQPAYQPQGPMQPAYQPYAPYPPQAAAAYPAASPYESLRGIAGVTVAFLGICAGWPVFSFLVARVVSPAGSGAALLYNAMRGVESLIGLVATILFLVWLHRVFVAIRVEQGPTRTSPGMAVGGWFIPVANLVLPFLAMREAWQRKMQGDRSFIVPLWWGTFVFTTTFRMVWDVAQSAGSNDILKVMGSVFPLPMLVRITAYVSWLLIVRWLTDRATAPAPMQGMNAYGR